MPHEFIRGLSTAYFSGRAQIVYDSYPNSDGSEIFSKNYGGELIFYLDGAHSPESMETCAKWFSNAVKRYEISSHSSFEVENAEESLENGHFLHESKTLEQLEKSFRRVGILKIIDCCSRSRSLTIIVLVITKYILSWMLFSSFLSYINAILNYLFYFLYYIIHCY